jgi:hypothetical protein
MTLIDEKARFAQAITINALGYLFVILMMWIFMSEELFSMSVGPLELGNSALLNNYRILSILTSFMTFMLIPLVKGFFINIQLPIYKKNYNLIKVLSVGFHAMLVLTMGEVIYLLPRILLSDSQFAFSLSQIFGNELSEPLRRILAYCDVFTIWYQFLVIIGIKTITGLPMRKSTQIVLLPVGLMLALTLFG